LKKDLYRLDHPVLLFRETGKVIISLAAAVINYLLSILGQDSLKEQELNEDANCKKKFAWRRLGCHRNNVQGLKSWYIHNLAKGCATTNIRSYHRQQGREKDLF
jgi:hypothetical protein